MEHNRKWGFYDNDKNLYSGNYEFIDAYSNALTGLMNLDTGKELITTLASDDDFIVTLTYNGEDASSSYKPKKQEINWNYKNPEAVPTEKGPDTNAITNLGHEFAHAIHHRNGNDMSAIWFTIKSVKKSIPISEIYTTHIENKLRAEMGAPIRTHYVITSKGNGKYERITQNGKSLYYDTYGRANHNFKRLPYYIKPYSYY